MSAHVLRLARWEVRQHARSRWIAVMAVVFTVACVMNALLGLRALRSLGLSGVGASVDGLIALGVLLPPLLALVVGAGTLSSARESKLLALLASQPVRRSAIVLGAFLGTTAVVWMTVAVGLGGALVILSSVAGAGDLMGLTTVVLATLAVSAAAAAIGVWIGTVASSRLQALAAAVVVWFTFALGLDLLFVGLAPGLQLGPQSLFAAVAVNPIESGRLLTLLTTRPDPASLGPFGTYMADRFGVPLGVALLGGTLAAWIVAPVAAACVSLRRRDV